MHGCMLGLTNVGLAKRMTSDLHKIFSYKENAHSDHIFRWILLEKILISDLCSKRIVESACHG